VDSLESEVEKDPEWDTHRYNNPKFSHVFDSFREFNNAADNQANFILRSRDSL
jgi:hypothetical protein